MLVAKYDESIQHFYECLRHAILSGDFLEEIT